MARKAKMSSEGLRKIEVGMRVPEPEVLQNILRACEVPEKGWGHYESMRARARAAKSGIDLSSFITDHKIEKVAQRVLNWIDEEVLGPLDMEFSAEEHEQHVPSLIEVIKKGL